ncbi:MAG: DUF7523 family protein [Candidatus Asgardarchaeia archaeon]
MRSIAKLVEEFVDTHPYIKEALIAGIINYSELARQIAKTLKITKTEAIIVALRRYRAKLKSITPHYSKKIIDICKKSKIEIKTAVYVYILPKYQKINNNVLAKIDGLNHTTIVSEDKLENIRPIKVQENLIAFIIISPKEIEETPGVIHFMTSILSERGINIYQLLSCYNETIFILKKEDLVNALSAFDRIMK